MQRREKVLSDMKGGHPVVYMPKKNGATVPPDHDCRLKYLNIFHPLFLMQSPEKVLSDIKTAVRTAD